MDSLDTLKNKLVERILGDVIKNIEVSLEEEVYLDAEAIGKELTVVVLEVLQEDETKKMIKEKIRGIIAKIDEKCVAKALEPDLGKGFLSRFFKTVCAQGKVPSLRGTG